MRCPGQDTRYWKEDAVFEVPCPKCGAAVEIFKDESSARCPSCRHRFKNPKIELGCAKWCAYAKECLGLALPREDSVHLGEGALAGRLIRAVKDEFKDDQARISHALVVFQHAKELAARTGGDPRVILAAALLLEIAAHGDQRAANPSAILQEIGLSEEAARQAFRIIAACQEGVAGDTIEYQAVCDAHRLTDLAAEQPSGSRLRSVIDRQLGTEAAKTRAQEMFQT